MPAVSPSEQVERSDGHAKPCVPCLKVSAPCLQTTELWEALGEGGGGSVLILGSSCPALELRLRRSLSKGLTYKVVSGQVLCESRFGSVLSCRAYMRSIFKTGV